MFKIILSLMLVFNSAFADSAMAYRHFFRHNAMYRMSANTALLWNPSLNQRYYDQGADRAVFAASTTKVLTALLVLEHLPLEQYVTVSAHATMVPQTKLGLRPGESYRVRDLLYGLLLKSANDAAVALAEAVGGSEAQFVALMNQRARQIGAMHTRFANPHGLPSQGPQFTTAADMALIFREALKNDFFRQALSYKYMVIYSKAGRRCFLKSHNKILFFDWHQHVFGKTGYTIEAQSCFVGYTLKGKDIIIIAVFGCHKRWKDIKYILEHYGHIPL